MSAVTGIGTASVNHQMAMRIVTDAAAQPAGSSDAGPGTTLMTRNAAVPRINPALRVVVPLPDGSRSVSVMPGGRVRVRASRGPAGAPMARVGGGRVGRGPYWRAPSLQGKRFGRRDVRRVV